MKILIVETEQHWMQKMTRFLKREGYICEQAFDFKEGFRKINNFEYGCAIISLNLPGKEGLRLVKMMRGEDTQAGILVTSGRDLVEERIETLEEGADDFLVQPFDLGEMLARIKAITRRKTGDYSRLLVFGGLVLKLDERVVLADGDPLKLTRKEFEILVHLARNKNRVVTKESIAEHLWGDYMDDAVSFDFIYAHVKNLRKKLTAHGFGDKLKTVYGVGYKFEAA